MTEWGQHVKLENVITRKFKKVHRMVHLEHLKFNRVFLEICSHIYFLFYHHYDLSTDQETPLLEHSQTPLLDSFLEGSDEIESVISGFNNKLYDKEGFKFKYFSFCENNLNPKSLPFSLALQSLLGDHEIPDEKGNLSIFKEQDLEVKVHSGVVNYNEEELDNDVVDLILGNKLDDGSRQYGVGVDTLRLLISALDQGK